MEEKNLHGEIHPDADQPVDIYYRNTFTIVSTVAYLIGVPKKIFENEHMSQDIKIFDKLNQYKNARIIRNLCILRTAIEKNFASINEKMHFEYKNLMSMPEYVPVDVIDALSADGIYIIKSNNKPVQYVIDFNRLIMDRINNCKEFFPSWLNWQYLRDIFIMPDGLTEEGTRAAASIYYTSKNYYPFQLYMNWPPSDQGNILYSDKKFVTLLYQWNQDSFNDYSKVTDVGSRTKNNIYDFLEESNHTVIVVDCENSDPYKLCAVLNNLEDDTMDKITKVVLYDDVHTANAWQILEHYVNVPMEHVLIERVKQNKSLVDIRLTAGACREFYQNNADSFIIVSSDSDYWGLISAMPEARFLVMIEREKCGPDMKSALASSGIFYCFIDDFYSGDNEEIKANAMVREARRFLDATAQFNIYDMLEQIARATRIELTEDEKKRFLDKYLKSMRLSIESDGQVRIELNHWK